MGLDVIICFQPHRWDIIVHCVSVACAHKLSDSLTLMWFQQEDWWVFQFLVNRMTKLSKAGIYMSVLYNQTVQNVVNHGQEPPTLYIIVHKVLTWNYRRRRPIGQTQSDRVQLIGYFCISSQWTYCSTLEYLASVCCSSCSALQELSTFPSSTCLDLLWDNFTSVICVGYSYMLNVQQEYLLHAHSWIGYVGRNSFRCLFSLQ